MATTGRTGTTLYLIIVFLYSLWFISFIFSGAVGWPAIFGLAATGLFITRIIRGDD
jgi:hypothetical protein